MDSFLAGKLTQHVIFRFFPPGGDKWKTNYKIEPTHGEFPELPGAFHAVHNISCPTPVMTLAILR